MQTVAAAAERPISQPPRIAHSCQRRPSARELITTALSGGGSSSSPVPAAKRKPSAGGTARMVNEKPAPYIGDANLNGTAEVYLAATETAKLAFLVYGGSKVVSISGTTTYRTYWAGHLVC